MAGVRQGSRDSDATATDMNGFNSTHGDTVEGGNGRKVLANPLVTPERGNKAHKKDEEAQVQINEKGSVSDSSIKV